MPTTTTKLKLPRPETNDFVTLPNQQAMIDAIDKGAASQAELDAHKNARNPHGTTAADVGAATTGHTHSNASSTAPGFMTALQNNKLAAIEEGAQVNKVHSVNNKTGTVSITAADVGAPTSTAFNNHVSDQFLHVTQQKQIAWDAKPTLDQTKQLANAAEAKARKQLQVSDNPPTDQEPGGIWLQTGFGEYNGPEGSAIVFTNAIVADDEPADKKSVWIDT